MAGACPIEVGEQGLRGLLEAICELGDESPCCLIPCGLNGSRDRALDPLVLSGRKVQLLEWPNHVHCQPTQQVLNRGVAPDGVESAGEHAGQLFSATAMGGRSPGVGISSLLPLSIAG
jgi:hypothetical protein